MRTVFASNDVVLDRAISRAKRRLIPFMLLMYLLSYLDRANIGYAKQAFQAVWGLVEAPAAGSRGQRQPSATFVSLACVQVPISRYARASRRRGLAGVDRGFTRRVISGPRQNVTNAQEPGAGM